MNKILNWITGSFFRTLGRIIAIGLISIIAYSFLSKSGFKISDLIGLQKVYADENFSYSNSLWSYTYSNLSTDCNSQLQNCSINPYPANMALNTTANVNYVNTLRLYSYASDTNKFKSSNYYTFKYEVCQTEKDFNAIKSRGRGFSWQYNTTNAATGATAGDPTQFSYRIDDKVGDNSCYYLSFSVKPPVDSRYIGFFFTYTGYGDNSNVAVIPDSTYFDDTGGTINVKTLSVTYSADVSASINNQTNQLIDNQNQNAQDIINNQNSNNQSIINNQNQNTQDIINNQNTNTQSTNTTITNQFQNCRNSYNLLNPSISNTTKNGITLTYDSTNQTITLNGTATSNTDFYFSSSIAVSIQRLYFLSKYLSGTTSGDFSLRAYNSSFSRGTNFILSNMTSDLSHNIYFTSPPFVLSNIFLRINSGATFNNLTFNLMISYYDSSFELYNQQICKNRLDEQTDAINNLNDSINDSDVSQSTSEASNLFTNFTNDSHGLTAVVQAPLNFIQSLSITTCSAVHIPLPFMENQYLDLPCLLPIYQEHFGTFLTLYQIILSGIIGYKIAVSVFYLVKDFKDPDSDKIEVLDL